MLLDVGAVGPLEFWMRVGKGGKAIGLVACFLI